MQVFWLDGSILLNGNEGSACVSLINTNKRQKMNQPHVNPYKKYQLAHPIDVVIVKSEGRLYYSCNAEQGGIDSALDHILINRKKY